MLALNLNFSCAGMSDHKEIPRNGNKIYHLFKVPSNLLHLTPSLPPSRHQQSILPNLGAADSFAVVQFQVAGHELEATIDEEGIALGVNGQDLMVGDVHREHILSNCLIKLFNWNQHDLRVIYLFVQHLICVTVGSLLLLHPPGTDTRVPAYREEVVWQAQRQTDYRSRMREAFKPHHVLTPVPNRNEAVVSPERHALHIHLHQRQQRILTAVLLVLHIELKLLRNLPNSDRAVVTAAGYVLPVPKKDNRSDLLRVALVTMQDLKVFPVPNPDELLLLERHDNQKGGMGDDEVNRSAMRVEGSFIGGDEFVGVALGLGELKNVDLGVVGAHVEGIIEDLEAAYIFDLIERHLPEAALQLAQHLGAHELRQLLTTLP